jgi:hypothetical protein
MASGNAGMARLGCRPAVRTRACSRSPDARAASSGGVFVCARCSNLPSGFASLRPKEWYSAVFSRSRRVRYFCKPKAHNYTISNGSRNVPLCARAVAQDSPGNLGGYRSDYPAPLLGCMADIQRSEAEDVGGREVGSCATGVGLRAALGRATAGICVGGRGLGASWRGRTRPQRSGGSPSCREGAERSGSRRRDQRATIPSVMAALRTGESQGDLRSPS